MQTEQASPIRAEWRSRRVTLSDGSEVGRVLALAALAALALAATGVLAWQWFPGATDVHRSFGGGNVEVPRSVVVAGLGLVAVLSSLLTWHAAGARSARPALALAGVAVSGLSCSLLALAWAGHHLLASTEYVRSFGASTRWLARRLEWVGAVGVATSVVVPLLGRFSGSRARVISTVSAAIAPTALAWIYLAEADRRTTVFGSVGSSGSGATTEIELDAVAAGQWLTVTIVAVAAGIALAVIAIVAVLGVREFADEKEEFASTAMRLGLPIGRTMVVGLGVVLGLLFALGRWGVIPGVRGSIPALSKAGVESWLIAACFAALALWMMRRAERNPVNPRGVTLPLLVVGAVLTSGHLLMALVQVLLVLSGPITHSVGWQDWLTRDVAGWAVWAQVWSSLVVPLGAAAWALWLRRCGERSDRTVFLASVAVISLLPGIQTVLTHRGIDSFLDDITVATADQVMLLGVAFATVAFVLRRSWLPSARLVRLQLLVLLATFVAALIATAVENRFFQLGLVLPLLFGLVRGGADTRDRPARGALALALAGALMAVMTAGMINGFVGETTSGSTELLVFLVLSGPLVLVELLPTNQAIVQEPRPPRRVPAALLPMVSGVLLVVGLIGLVNVGPDLGARPLRVDVELHDGWSGVQELIPEGESVGLYRGEMEVVARSLPGLQPICATGVGGLISTDDPGVDAGFVGGLPARRYQLADGSGWFLTCGEQASDDGTSYLLVVHPQALDDETLAQLSAFSFAVSDG